MGDPATIAGAVIAGISVLIGIIEILRHCRGRGDDSVAVDDLRLSIDTAWTVLTTLQRNDTSGSEKKAIQTLTRWCYDAEDLSENIQPEREKILGKCSELLRIFDHVKQKTQEPHQSNTTPGTTNRRNVPLVGRDDDVTKIIEIIVSPDRLENNGISIQGMFGVGKSCLAWKIYIDREFVGAFCPIWVNDGQFDLENVKKTLVDENTLSSSNGPKKFLIFIDNLQSLTTNESDNFWTLKNEYPDKDIRIIITTRNPEIPKLTNTSRHELEALQEEYCGDVIKAYANVYCSDLSDIRFQSAIKSAQQKCEGLPMVASLYGIYLGYYMSSNEWTKVSEAETSSLLPEVKKDIFPKLMSSIYEDLKPGLWRCLGYFSLFPHGHLFDIEDFFHLCIAESFIPFEHRSEPPPSLKKYVREELVNYLKKSIIVQSPEQTMYKLHACGSIAVSAASSESYLRLDQNHLLSSEALKNNPPRHLSILYKPEVLNELKKLRKLRTFLSLHGEGNILQHEGKLPQLDKVVSSVRVLSLKGINFRKFPISIGELKHLRYLNISFTRVEKLPKDICSLHALQFLKLEGINLLDSKGKVTVSFFPPKFHELINLLYVDWKEDLLRAQPAIYKIGKLDRLENLPLFKVGRNEGYLISELKEMNNLQGSLYIQDLDEYVRTTNATEANLQAKHNLRTIVLEWKGNSSESAHYENILKALQFHNYVEEFQLKKYGGEKLPEWIKNTFLQKIQLVDCRSCSFFPTLGKLQKLEILVLEYMHVIENISCGSPDDTHTDGQFPSLKRLELHNMSQLKSLTGVQPCDMLRLQDVKIVNCGEMVSVSFLEHLKEFKSLTIERSPKLSDLFRNNEKRDHIPYIEIDGVELPFPNANSPTQTSINSTSMCSLVIRNNERRDHVDGDEFPFKNAKSTIPNANSPTQPPITSANTSMPSSVVRYAQTSINSSGTSACSSNIRKRDHSDRDEFPFQNTNSPGISVCSPNIRSEDCSVAKFHSLKRWGREMLRKIACCSSRPATDVRIPKDTALASTLSVQPSVGLTAVGLTPRHSRAEAIGSRLSLGMTEQCAGPYLSSSGEAGSSGAGPSGFGGTALGGDTSEIVSSSGAATGGTA